MSHPLMNTGIGFTSSWRDMMNSSKAKPRGQAWDGHKIGPADADCLLKYRVQTDLKLKEIYKPRFSR